MPHKTFNMQEYCANEKSVLNSPYELCKIECKQLESYPNFRESSCLDLLCTLNINTVQ